MWSFLVTGAVLYLIYYYNNWNSLGITRNYDCHAITFAVCVCFQDPSSEHAPLFNTVNESSFFSLRQLLSDNLGIIFSVSSSRNFDIPTFYSRLLSISSYLKDVCGWFCMMYKMNIVACTACNCLNKFFTVIQSFSAEIIIIIANFLVLTANIVI